MGTRVGRFESNERLDVIRDPENPDWIGFATDSQTRPVTVPPLANRMDAIARVDDLPSVTRLLSGRCGLHGRQFPVAREQLGLSEEMGEHDFYLIPTEFGPAVYSRKGEGKTLYPVNTDPLVPPSYDVMNAYRGNGISIEDAGSSRPSLWVEQRVLTPSDFADYLVQQGFSPRIARTLAIGGGLTFVAALTSGCINPVDSTPTTDQPNTPSQDTPVGPTSTPTGGTPTIVTASPTIGPTPRIDIPSFYNQINRYHENNNTGCVLVPGDALSGISVDYLLNTLVDYCYAIRGENTPEELQKLLIWSHLIGQIPEEERGSYSPYTIPERHFREKGIYVAPGIGGPEGGPWRIYNPTPTPPQPTNTPIPPDRDSDSSQQNLDATPQIFLDSPQDILNLLRRTPTPEYANQGVNVGQQQLSNAHVAIENLRQRGINMQLYVVSPGSDGVLRVIYDDLRMRNFVATTGPDEGIDTRGVPGCPWCVFIPDYALNSKSVASWESIIKHEAWHSLQAANNSDLAYHFRGESEGLGTRFGHYARFMECCAEFNGAQVTYDFYHPDNLRLLINQMPDRPGLILDACEGNRDAYSKLMEIYNSKMGEGTFQRLFLPYN